MYNVQNILKLNIITNILTKQSYIELDIYIYIEREREKGGGGGGEISLSQIQLSLLVQNNDICIIDRAI